MTPVTRRTFLKSTAAATIAATAPASASANDRVNVAIIGCRNRGHQNASSFLSTGEFNVVALCDCDTAMVDVALKKLDGQLDRKPALETDFRRVLENSDVDAVAICTPDHWHAVMTLLALDAGKHVYVEKPVSFTIDEGRAMSEAARKRPELTVAVGTQQRSGEHFKDAKAFVAEGGLGKVAFARAWITHTRDSIHELPDSKPPATLDYEMWVGPATMHPHNDSRTHYNWRWVRDWGTGEMGNWGAHWLDVARWLLDLDLPVAATGHGGPYSTKDTKDWPDTQTVLYEYPELTLLWEQRLWTEYTVNSMRSGVELDGEKGTLLIDRSGWVFHPRDGKAVRYSRSELARSHARNFARAIRGDETVAASIEEGHKSAALCHLGNLSTILGRRIEFDGEGQTIVNDAEAASLQHRENRAPWRV